MLLDGLGNLFLQALRFDGNDATVLVMRWNEEIDYIQSVFDNMTSNKPKPSICTNADLIRAMTDEELAEWIYSVTTNALNILQIGSDAPTQSYFGWLNWLRQEVQG